ncbi:MAG TPA: peptidoglycan recognition protein [Actinomycetota bacterium]
MAEHPNRPRGSARAAILIAVLTASVAGLPFLPRGEAVPETVLRSVPIDVRTLLRPGPGLSLGADSGGLRAAERARTVTASACAPIWFDGMAFTWHQASGAAVTIRTAAGGPGRYWRAVTLEPEGGPDPGTPEYRPGQQGSAYLWTGGARCARFSLELPAGAELRDLRVLFINSSGTAEGPGTGPRDVGPVATGDLGPPFGVPRADAMTQRPRIIAREQWGANPKLMNCTPWVAPFLKMGFIHHTAGSNAYSRAQADDVVRGVYAYHTNGRGWCDIGYNFLVDRYGDVFEGRSGGVTNDVVGAAQMGFNTGAFSVSMMGNFDAVRPPAHAVGVLERLIAWRLDVAHVNPRARTVMVSAGGSTTRFQTGTEVRLRTISGHRDTGLTACPGRYLYPLIPAIRDVAGSMGLPKIYQPTLSTTSIPSDGPLSVRIRARSSASFAWRVIVLGPSGDTVVVIRGSKGPTLDVRWVADGSAQPLEAGEYRVLVETTGAVGGRARPATLTVVAEPPPSPSPTLTPTPTPTVSPTP